MAFRSIAQFGHYIRLPFPSGVVYKIGSPRITVGNYMVEVTQFAARREELVRELIQLEPEDPRVEELKSEITDITSSLEIPDEVQGDYFGAVLGEAYSEMVEKEEPFEIVKLAATTVSVWVVSGLDIAEEFWNSGGRPPRPTKPATKRRTKATSQ